jgi:hypothetical protein
MCGRYLTHAEPELIARAFGLEFSETARDLGIGALRPSSTSRPFRPCRSSATGLPRNGGS